MTYSWVGACFRLNIGFRLETYFSLFWASVMSIQTPVTSNDGKSSIDSLELPQRPNEKFIRESPMFSYGQFNLGLREYS